MNPIFYIDPSEINLFDDNEFESASIYVTKSHFDGNSVPVYTEQPVDYERLKISAKQQELELLAVIEKQHELLSKSLKYPAQRFEPSQALRENEAKVLEDAAVWFEQREYLSVVEHLRRMAEERRKK